MILQKNYPDSQLFSSFCSSDMIFWIFLFSQSIPGMIYFLARASESSTSSISIFKSLSLSSTTLPLRLLASYLQFLCMYLVQKILSQCFFQVSNWVIAQAVLVSASFYREKSLDSDFLISSSFFSFSSLILFCIGSTSSLTFEENLAISSQRPLIF